MMELSFLGGAETVTGSKYLVKHSGGQLLVDCGLFQGLKRLRLKNWEPLPVKPSDLQAVILTHAHLDHSGYLPVLVRDGFKGPIYCTTGTRDLCTLLLPDSGHLLEEEAARANRYGYSKHDPARPLYTRAEAEACLSSFVPVAYEQWTRLGGEADFKLERAGHLIGSASVTLWADEHTTVFSGDLGRPHDPILKPPAKITEADYLIVESTYGDREHDAVSPDVQLGEVVKRTAARGGVIVIPAFAVGRAQSVLYYLHVLKQRGDIPDIPTFVDSPMATDATRILISHADEHNVDAHDIVAACKSATFAHSVAESKAIDARIGPMIIISASGMATGGRVLFHLERFAGDPRNTILFTGHQAAGTRGASMIAGAKHVKMHGGEIDIRAEVVALHGLSAHADGSELIDWLSEFQRPPTMTFVTHGEPAASDALRRRITDSLQWPVTIPREDERVVIIPA